MEKNGMIIALMDEYRRAAKEYKKVLATISDSLFEKIIDKETKDIDCKSIQNITFHLVQSGYTYINYINTKSQKEWLEYVNKIVTPKKGIEEIDKMLDFTEDSLTLIINKTNKELEEWEFETRWHAVYDFEQLMEHAIVHFLRHRRQVENIIKLN